MIKEIFTEFLELFKKPTTKLIELSKSETTKKILIKGAIVCVAIALLTMITTISSINERYKYDESKYSASYYSDKDRKGKKEDLKKDKDEAMKEAELIPSFFRTIAVSAVAIGVGALILFVITKMLKTNHSYFEELSMVVNIFIIVALGTIVGKILGLLYIPLGLITTCATYIFGAYTLAYAFKDSLEIENSDKLVLFTTLIYVIALIIIFLLISSKLSDASSALKSLDSLDSLSGSSFTDLF